MATRSTFPTLEPERGRQPERAPDGPAGAANERSSARPSPLTHRVCLLIAIIGLFGPALITWTSIIQLPTVGVISALGFAVTSVLGIMALTCKSEHSLARLDWAVLGAAIVLLGTWAATELYFYPAYGTDEAAFVQYAAQLTLHGHNPYKANLLPALTEFRVPIQWATYKLDGTIASNLAYPSLSFLLVIPVVLLTHGVQAVIAENVLFLTVEMILLFLFLPRAYRALSVVAILGLPFLFDNAIGGVIVTLAVPFMIVVAYRWSDIGRGGRLGRGGVARAICLGLAACVSQYPWFVAPFVILGLWRCRSIELGRREAARLAARFLGISTGVALAVNLPFIVWGPAAWFKGVLSPIFQQAIPFGQELIDATVFFHIGGGNIAYYTYAAIAIFAALLVAYGVYFQVLWRAAFILPAAAFYFSTRSLAEYFIMMVAIWIASLLAAGAGRTSRSTSHLASPGGRDSSRSMGYCDATGRSALSSFRSCSPSRSSPSRSLRHHRSRSLSAGFRATDNSEASGASAPASRTPRTGRSSRTSQRMRPDT